MLVRSGMMSCHRSFKIDTHHHITNMLASLPPEILNLVLDEVGPDPIGSVIYVITIQDYQP